MWLKTNSIILDSRHDNLHKSLSHESDLWTCVKSFSITFDVLKIFNNLALKQNSVFLSQASLSYINDLFHTYT